MDRRRGLELQRDHGDGHNIPSKSTDTERLTPTAPDTRSHRLLATTETFPTLAAAAATAPDSPVARLWYYVPSRQSARNNRRDNTEMTSPTSSSTTMDSDTDFYFLDKKPKTTPVEDDYKISNNVLGLGINGKVVQCFSVVTGEKFALKVRTSRPSYFHFSLVLFFSFSI